MLRALAAVLCPGASAAAASFDILLGAPSSPFSHVWEESVGSGHMALALRADWREQLTRAQKELGFKRVRMHGMLNDDMSVSLGPPVPDHKPPYPGGYSFVNLNSVIDFLTKIGMDAFFEVGFMPRWLALNASSTVFHYQGITSPPRSYAEWGEVIETVARHLYDRYGETAIEKWFFEIWNEPDIHFWSGNPQQATYFELYKHTVNAFHRVSPKFRVGGPATSGLGWIPEFLDFCNSSGVGSPDFVSTHKYAGGSSGSIYDASGLVAGFKKARAQTGDVPLFITEWGGSWAHVPQLDDTAYAPFIVSSLAQAQNVTSLMSLWCFSDVFEETGMAANSVTYSAGFGLMNVYGVPKPSYRALQLLHMAGEQRIPVARQAGDCNTASVLALTNKTHLAIFVTNEAPLPLHDKDPVGLCNVTIALPHGVGGDGSFARIDDTHSNPKAAWESMGSPPYPTAAELETLEAASDLNFEPLLVRASEFTVTLPRGLVVVFLPLSEVASV